MGSHASSQRQRHYVTNERVARFTLKDVIIILQYMLLHLLRFNVYGSDFLDPSICRDIFDLGDAGSVGKQLSS